MIMLHVRILSLLCCCAALLWLGTCRLAPPTSCSPPPIPVVIWMAGSSSNSLDCSGGVAVTCSNASWSENWVRRSLTPCARESSGSSDLSRFTAARTKLMVYSKKCDIQATKVGPLFIFGILSLKLVNRINFNNDLGGSIHTSRVEVANKVVWLTDGFDEDPHWGSLPEHPGVLFREVGEGPLS